MREGSTAAAPQHKFPAYARSRVLTCTCVYSHVQGHSIKREATHREGQARHVVEHGVVSSGLHRTVSEPANRMSGACRKRQLKCHVRNCVNPLSVACRKKQVNCHVQNYAGWCDQGKVLESMTSVIAGINSCLMHTWASDRSKRSINETVAVDTRKMRKLLDGVHVLKKHTAAENGTGQLEQMSESLVHECNHVPENPAEMGCTVSTK